MYTTLCPTATVKRQKDYSQLLHILYIIVLLKQTVMPCAILKSIVCIKNNETGLLILLSISIAF